MKTKFSPNDGTFSSSAHHRAAGEAWLVSYSALARNGGSTTAIGWGVFYVLPFMLSFCLELFVKALVGYENPGFSAKKANHGTAELIRSNIHIPVLATIAGDTDLMELIEEYDKVKDIKYGELGVMIDGDEQQQVLAAVLAIRAELETRSMKNKPSATAITANVPCPICGVAIGEPCRVDDGNGGIIENPETIHTSRIPQGWKNPET
jgi:hypothetical protein